MRPNGQVAAMLLLVAASAAVGCSKSDETPRTKAEESRDSGQPKPPAMSGGASAIADGEEEGFDAIATPKITGPVSFADGEAAYQAGNYGDAARMFEHYTGQRPKNAWGHFMLGLSAWKGGDLARAETALEAALRIDPNHVKSLVNLGRVLIDQKRLDAAVDRLTRAGEIDPQSTDVHRLLGRAYHAKGQTDEAIDAYRRALALDEKDAWSMNNLGLLLLEQRRANEAVPLLASAVELEKDVPAFHNNLGMALEHTGRFVAAAEAYKGALAADPAYGKARQNLARVEAVKGSYETTGAN